uniref:ATP-binding protein n=1 Tax=Collinsella bouchesdurhonensis TaxID=1907654 RepID=UPI00359C8B7F
MNFLGWLGVCHRRAFLERFLSPSPNWLAKCSKSRFLPLDADGARPLFRAFADAYETQLAAIATNPGLSRWGPLLGDDRMAAAAIDRIVHHGRLVQFRGESRRVRHALMREG